MKYTGNTLIKLGFYPNKYFGKILEKLNESDLRGFTDEDIKSAVSSMIPKEPEQLLPYDEAVGYYKNIEASNDFERDNIKSVEVTMDALMKTPTIVGGAIMPDACPVGGGHIPVGGIVVTKNAIHPNFHSADVCCSLMSTDLGLIDPALVMDAAFSTTQFGPGGRKEHGGWEDTFYDNKFLVDKILGNHFTKDYVVKAAKHLGTQGDGNHFLFVGISEKTGHTHLVTHHGSRGFGSSVFKKGIAAAEKYRQVLSPKTDKINAWIPYDTVEGKAYWEALQIVRDWTHLNHSSIHNRIGNKLKVQYLHRFWNEHNFVFKDGNDFYHAKGATPLDAKFVPDSQDGLRLIPLNMAQPILVVKGKTTASNLGFAPHGAGRNISRAQHKRMLGNQTIEYRFKKETEGLDVRFFSGKIDISELPSAYKNADGVIEAMDKFGLGEIVDKIMPYGSIMAGEQEKKW